MSATYVHLSMLVGAVQIADAAFLLKCKGKITNAVVWFSFFEYAWAVYSAIEATSEASHTPQWLPISFIGWIVVGALTGAVITARNKNKHTLPTIPLWSVVGGGLFGLYFLTASMWLAAIARLPA